MEGYSEGRWGGFRKGERIKEDAGGAWNEAILVFFLSAWVGPGKKEETLFLSTAALQFALDNKHGCFEFHFSYCKRGLRFTCHFSNHFYFCSAVRSFKKKLCLKSSCKRVKWITNWILSENLNNDLKKNLKRALIYN